jgi:hypothetical protein
VSRTIDVKRGRIHQGEDRVLAFDVEHESTESPDTWELSFVWRDASRTCPGHEDPGDGALRFSKDTADMTVTTVSSTRCTIEVPVDRTDTLSLEPDDYYAALWRTDDGNDRPLSILRYIHLTGVPRQTTT